MNCTAIDASLEEGQIIDLSRDDTLGINKDSKINLLLAVQNKKVNFIAGLRKKADMVPSAKKTKD